MRRGYKIGLSRDPLPHDPLRNVTADPPNDVLDGLATRHGLVPFADRYGIRSVAHDNRRPLCFMCGKNTHKRAVFFDRTMGRSLCARCAVERAETSGLLDRAIAFCGTNAPSWWMRTK